VHKVHAPAFCCSARPSFFCPHAPSEQIRHQRDFPSFLPFFPSAAFEQDDSLPDAGGNSFGVAVGDLNNDGYPEIYVTNYNSANQLFLNKGESGDGFEDVAAMEDVLGDENVQDASSPSIGVAFGDLDGDGDVDIYITNDGKANRLYINNLLDNGGSGSILDFTEVAGQHSVDDNNQAGRGVVLGDLDGDGDLDIYVANNGQANRLYRNDGGLQFVEVAADSGVADTGDHECVTLGDLDGDGDLDIYILDKKGGDNKLFRNNGGLKFEDVAEDSNVQDFSGKGHGVAFGDLDNDGDLDIYVANNEGHNRLFRNDGSLMFVEVAQDGVAADTTGSRGRGVAMGDFDNDGDLDIYVTNGATDQPNRLFINKGSLEFTENADAYDIAGKVDDVYGAGHGVALGDFDQDGDIDMYLANYELIEGFGNVNRLYENKASESANSGWLFVRPTDSDGHLRLQGATVRLLQADTSTVHATRTIDGGGGYCSQNAYDVHFGLGSLPSDDPTIT
jgi:hypothetical protein